MADSEKREASEDNSKLILSDGTKLKLNGSQLKILKALEEGKRPIFSRRRSKWIEIK